MTIPTSLADAALDVLGELPPADRAQILRQQIALLEAAADAARRSLAESAIAAVVIAARDLGIEMPVEAAGTGAAPEADLDRLEIEVAEIDENLPPLRDALAAIEAGCARAV